MRQKGSPKAPESSSLGRLFMSKPAGGRPAPRRMPLFPAAREKEFFPKFNKNLKNLLTNKKIECIIVL